MPTIQQAISDALKQCTLPKITVLRFSPFEDVGARKLRIQSSDEDQSFFIDAVTHDDHPEIIGEFAVQDFKTLRGLLNMPNFQGDDAVFKIGTRKVGGDEYPDSFEFKGGGTKATFVLVNHVSIPDEIDVMNIPWDIRIELSPSKIAEFQQMAALYGPVEDMFTVRTDEGALLVDFGNEGSSTHSATMTLAEEAGGSLIGDMRFSIPLFLALLKIATDSKAFELRLTSRGLLGLHVVTDAASYNFYLKRTRD